jgi:hypothetical protein
MTIGVHDFAIPHDRAQPTRDMVIIRLPLPPKMVGSLLVPDLVRDMAQHNVMAGRIVKMGPLAFTYKDGSGLNVQEANVGDWVVIRPFAGTMLQGGKLQINSGWRYVSSFQDVIAVVPAADMPDPSTLLWDEDESQQGAEGGATDIKASAKARAEEDFKFEAAVREKVVYGDNHYPGT